MHDACFIQGQDPTNRGVMHTFVSMRGSLSWISAGPDCAPSVHESYVFTTLGLALSEKQIPQIVENIGNQNKGGNDWRGLRFFASRGPRVRVPPRPPISSIICGDLGRAPASTAGALNEFSAGIPKCKPIRPTFDRFI